MGLNIVVGIMGRGDDEDEDEFDAYLQEVSESSAAVQEALARAGAGKWDDPGPRVQDAFDCNTVGCLSLHVLRRLAVYLARTGLPPEPRALEEAADDPVLARAYDEGPSDPPGPFDHLIYHSDAQGFYVPVDFALVIIDEDVEGAFLGSSVRLLDETRRIAAALGLPEDLDPESGEMHAALDAETPAATGWQRYPVESYGCLQLMNAAKKSIQTGAAITFC